MSIPIFTSQLEKAREATDFANMRAAKAALVTKVLDGDTANSDKVFAYDAVKGELVASDATVTGYGKGIASNQVHSKDVQEDDFNVEEELKKPAFSKRGDVWHLGKHTVICGDSTDPDTYKILLGDIKVNLVCTDAPYFVNLKNKSGTIANDDLSDKEAYAFLMKCFSNFKESMANDASIYEFYATMKSRVFYDAFEDSGFKVGAGLIWKKPRAPFMRTDWKFNMEPIIFGWKKDGKHIWYGDQKQTAVFEFDGIKDS